MNTTIAVTEEVRIGLQELGTKGESYNDILKKLLNNAREQQLRDILMDETNTVPIEEALQKAKKQWQK